MATRGIICVVLDNEFKLASFVTHDAYPDHLGAEALRFASFLEYDPANFKQFAENLRASSFAEPDEPSLQEASAKVLWLVHDHSYGNLPDDTELAADSLFCEWGYVIDLDARTVECYKGFNHLELSEGDRFYYLEPEALETSQSRTSLFPDSSIHPIFKVGEVPMARWEESNIDAIIEQWHKDGKERGTERHMVGSLLSQ